MKMSTKGRYGLRAMVDIAVNNIGGENCVSLKSVAERQDISERYLEQLIVPLKKAGIVKSTRGAHGGYVLARPAREITVGEILRALEGPIKIVECSGAGEGCRSEVCKTCVTRGVWEKLSESLSETADAITLETLAKQSMAQ